MLCRLCQIFDGDDQGLCAGCRALRRIREVQCGGGLLLHSQQARAVSALRDCAGALLDLAEEAIRIRKKEKEEAAAEGEREAEQAAGGSGSGSTPVTEGDAASGSGKPVAAPTEEKEVKVKDELGLGDDGSEEAPGVLGVAAVEEGQPLEGGREKDAKEGVKVKKRRRKHTGTSSKKDGQEEEQRKEEEGISFGSQRGEAGRCGGTGGARTSSCPQSRCRQAFRTSPNTATGPKEASITRSSSSRQRLRQRRTHSSAWTSKTFGKSSSGSAEAG